MAIFPNTPKNDINSLTQIFNKKDKKIGKKLYIYIPILSNFLLEKTFNKLKKIDTIDNLTEFTSNISTDNFLLEIDLVDEKTLNTPQFILNKKINIFNSLVISNSSQTGLVENIQVIRSKKLFNNINNIFNIFKSEDSKINFYLNFLQRNKKIYTLLENLFTTTKQINNSNYKNINNLLLTENYEKEEIYILDQIISSNVYTEKTKEEIISYFKYNRLKNDNYINPSNNNDILSISLLLIYIISLQNNFDETNKDIINNSENLLPELFKIKDINNNDVINNILLNKNISNIEKINQIVQSFLNNNLFTKDNIIQFVPGLENNSNNIKELLSTYQWNSNGKTFIKNMSTSFNENVDRKSDKYGFIAVENKNKNFLINKEITDKIFSSIKLEGKNKLVGEESTIIITQFPINSQKSIINNYIDLFKNKRNTNYFEENLIDYKTYLQKYTNSHSLKHISILDEFTKDLEYLFSIDLNPKNDYGFREKITKGYDKTFRDLYKKLNLNLSYENVYGDYDLYFLYLKSLTENISIDYLQINSKINEILDRLSDNVRSSETYNIVKNISEELSTSLEQINIKIEDIYKNLELINELQKKEFAKLNFLTNNSFVCILYLISIKNIKELNNIYSNIYPKNNDSLQLKLILPKEYNESNRQKNIDIFTKLKTTVNELQNIISSSPAFITTTLSIYDNYKKNINTYNEKTVTFFNNYNTNTKILFEDPEITEAIYIKKEDLITKEKFRDILNNKKSNSVFFIETDDDKYSLFICKKELTKILSNLEEKNSYFEDITTENNNIISEEISDSHLLHTQDFSYVTTQDWLQTPFKESSSISKKNEPITKNIQRFINKPYKYFSKDGDKIIWEDDELIFQNLNLENNDSYLSIDYDVDFNNILINNLNIDLKEITIEQLKNIFDNKREKIKSIEQNIIRHLVFGYYQIQSRYSLTYNYHNFRKLYVSFINKWADIGVHDVINTSSEPTEIEIFKNLKVKPILEKDISLNNLNNSLVDNFFEKDNTISFFRNIVIPILGKQSGASLFYYKIKSTLTESLLDLKDSIPIFINNLKENENKDGVLNESFNIVNKNNKKLIPSIINFTYNKIKEFAKQDFIFLNKQLNSNIDDLSVEENDEVIKNLNNSIIINVKSFKRTLENTKIPIHFGLIPFYQKQENSKYIGSYFSNNIEEEETILPVEPITTLTETKDNIPNSDNISFEISPVVIPKEELLNPVSINSQTIASIDNYDVKVWESFIKESFWPRPKTDEVTKRLKPSWENNPAIIQRSAHERGVHHDIYLDKLIRNKKVDIDDLVYIDIGSGLGPEPNKKDQDEPAETIIDLLKRSLFSEHRFPIYLTDYSPPEYPPDPVNYFNTNDSFKNKLLQHDKNNRLNIVTQDGIFLSPSFKEILKNNFSKKYFIIRVINSIEKLEHMNTRKNREAHFETMANQLKDKIVFYMYNKYILYKSEASTRWIIYDKINNDGLKSTGDYTKLEGVFNKYASKVL